MKKILFLIIIFLFSAYFVKAQTAEQPNVVINEVAWMGTTVSVNDEWIELKNSTNQNINLDGWTLRAADGAPEIKLTGVIWADSFYLIERTDDNTVLNVTADLIYKGALGNNGEDLWLYDGNNNLIDEVNATEKWFAGDNTTKQTMEKSSGGWQTSKDIGGTPKAQNSIIIAEEKTTALPPTYPFGIIFNEILPSPDGADEENEWIELYNTNGYEVDLSGWKIKDKEGSPTNYSLPENTKIPTYGYLVLKRTDTKITLNNTTDGLTIYWPNEKIIDSMSYEKAVTNQSYNKTGENWPASNASPARQPNSSLGGGRSDAGWQWSASLSPGAKNIVAQNNNIIERSENLLKTEKSGSSNEVDAGLAAFSQSVSEKNINPWFLFIAALIITILSVIIVLFIKFKFHVRT